VLPGVEMLVTHEGMLAAGGDTHTWGIGECG
jgi:hypothetical protein